GPEKPLPKDISKLASVRPHAVEKALVWLKQNNPLYRDIEINYMEMATWEDSEAGVPKEVYRRLERHESTAREKIFTAPIVPPEARGLEAEGPVDINQLLASLHEDDERGIIPHSDVLGDVDDFGDEAERVWEVTATGMFDVDGRPRLAEADGLQYLSNAVHNMGSASGEMHVLGITADNHSNSEPVIRATRGGAFSDSFDPAFFPMAFPTLFPYGSGGPRLAEEDLQTGVPVRHNGAPRDLVSSRNLALYRWARLLLQRHGARFSAHPVFSFLVFNMGSASVISTGTRPARSRSQAAAGDQKNDG
ncbi:hypothetical protein CPLU01_16141, partial [Colletotrichum plurivorum]